MLTRIDFAVPLIPRHPSQHSPMKLAYLDCASGISGDMTLGALLDAGVELAAIQDGIDSLGLPHCRLVTSQVKKHGFRATQLVIEHPPEHKHRHLHHIVEMIDRSRLTARQQDLARRIFQKLAEAEAKVHGSTIEKVHFHEVGAVDSIADIVGTAIAWDRLDVDRIVASPIPTGTGTIHIAHGQCSIPAPATAELLTGIPLAPSHVAAELTTPTGAAILATMVQEFGPLPAMTIRRIGYGAGQRELAEQPNLLRLILGDAVAAPLAGDEVWILETNLDDATGELIGHCLTLLGEAGALDAYTLPIQMKKNRPGVLLSVLCHAADVDRLAALIFRETTTLGIRRWPASRHTLLRREHSVDTTWGPIRGKLAWWPNQPPHFTPEYEACRQLALDKQLPLRDIYEAALRAYHPPNS